MNSILVFILPYSNTDKENIVNCDDGWEEDWNEGEQGGSIMLLMF